MQCKTCNKRIKKSDAIAFDYCSYGCMRASNPCNNCGYGDDSGYFCSDVCATNFDAMSKRLDGIAQLISIRGK